MNPKEAQSSGSVQRPVRPMQCSGRRLGPDAVLISCGGGFLETDNKGVADMITVLARLLAGGEFCRLEEAHDLSRPNRPAGCAEESMTGASSLVVAPTRLSYPTESQNRCQCHHRNNVVHLFCVNSYERANRPNDPSSATRRTGRTDCNRDAPAGFAAAHG